MLDTKMLIDMIIKITSYKSFLTIVIIYHGFQQ